MDVSCDVKLKMTALALSLWQAAVHTIMNNAIINYIKSSSVQTFYDNPFAATDIQGCGAETILDGSGSGSGL